MLVKLFILATFTQLQSSSVVAAVSENRTSEAATVSSDHPCDVIQCHIWVVQAEKDGKAKPCNDSYFSGLTKSMRDEQPEAPDWFFDQYREQLRSYHCADKCAWGDAWRIGVDRLKIHWHQIRYSQSAGRVIAHLQDVIFLFFFSPLLLLTNVINVRILRHMLGSASASIRYHAADVYSDIVFGIVQTIFAAQIWEVLSPLNPRCSDIWFQKWFYHPKLWLMGLSDAAIMSNQMFNLCLIVDRWIGLNYPSKYIVYSSAKFSMRPIKAIIVICVVLNFLHPINCFSVAWFYSDISAEEMVARFNTRLQISCTIMMFAKTFTVFAVYIMEVFFGVRVLIGWRKFVKLRNAHAADQTHKYKEGQKLCLLVGTIGISLICITPFVVGMLYNGAAKLGYEFAQDSFWRNLVEGVAGMLAPMGGLSSSASMLCHVLFTKTYRQAFVETFGLPTKVVKVEPTSSGITGSTNGLVTGITGKVTGMGSGSGHGIGSATGTNDLFAGSGHVATTKHGWVATNTPHM